MVNVVNSMLAFLLPFALTPLVKYNCSEEFLGRFAASKKEKYLLYTLCFIIWLINACAFSAEGGGLFGDTVHSMEMSVTKVGLLVFEISLQVRHMFAWYCLPGRSVIVCVACQMLTFSASLRPLDLLRLVELELFKYTNNGFHRPFERGTSCRVATYGPII
jgi:hypothetical protein